MRFNGVDPRTVHPALSVNKEIYPGMARREVITVRGNSGETLAGYQEERAEAVIRMNIGAKTRAEAYAARAALAGWAASSGENTAPLEPTYWTGKAYDAILAEIGEPEFTRGFATVDVTFILPRPYAREMNASSAIGGGTLTAQVGGSARARPTIRQTLSEAANELTWSTDGAPFLKLTGSLSAGAVIEADFANGSLTVDGVHSEALIDYTATTWRPAFTPGRHTIASTDGGQMEARWHNEWI